MDLAITIFMGVFLVFLVVAVLLVFVSSLFHLKHKVPFVPTPAGVIEQMISEANLKPGMHVVDLGAGDGRILRRAMKRVPGIIATGYEGAFGVWLLSRFLNAMSMHKPDMRREDFFEADLSKVDVVFTYLSINVMQKLYPKLEKELRPGTKVITNTFSFRQREPDKKVFVKMPFWGGTNVLIYTF